MDQAIGLRRHAGIATADWRVFLRALAEEIDHLAGGGERDDMLRGVGRRMARLAPLPEAASLASLEVEMNDALDLLGWGEVRLRLNEADHTLEIAHTGMPRIGSLGTPSGQWLSALLEGLYDGWLGQQPGHRANLFARRSDGSRHETVMLTYASH